MKRKLFLIVMGYGGLIFLAVGAWVIHHGLGCLVLGVIMLALAWAALEK